MKKWTASDIENAKHLGYVEIPDEKGDLTPFAIFQTPDRLVFGGACNVGFIESGFIEREEGESLDETLQELIDDLEVYYVDGSQFVSRIVCNERM